MNIPAKVTAGDSAAWVEPSFTLQDGTFTISSPTWSLSLSVRGPLATGLDLAGAVDGQGGWAFALTPAQSALLNASPNTLLWYWQLTATNGAQRLTPARGVLKVKANLAALAPTATFDGRSQAEQTLTAIETEIAARINGGATLEYTIGQRSLKKEPIQALMGLRTTYRQIVARERRASKPGTSDLQLAQIQFR